MNSCARHEEVIEAKDEVQNTEEIEKCLAILSPRL
jgi:hypothetical protein